MNGALELATPAVAMDRYGVTQFTGGPRRRARTCAVRGPPSTAYTAWYPRMMCFAISLDFAPPDDRQWFGGTAQRDLAAHGGDHR